MEPVPQLAAPSRMPRLWAFPLAALGVVAVLAPMVATMVPSTAFIDKSRCTEFDTTSDTYPPPCVAAVHEPVEFALVPADAEPVLPRLAIAGVPTFEEHGNVYFITVRQPPITMLDWFVTRENKAARFYSHRDKYGDQSEDQLIQAGQQQMRSAKDNAMYVALKAAGYDVTLQPGNVIIDYLLCLEANAAGTECVKYSPADALLNPGDVLKKVNGVDVTIIDDLSQALSDIPAGEMIPIEFERDGVALSGEIETILAPGEDPPRTIIGFRPIDTTTVTLPPGLTVQFKTDAIGGPSAGLAFTLSLIDALTEGDLTGGLDVAVTGTIDVEGHVGAIGGLNSKASAVKQVGVKYFLVPVNQGADGDDGILRAREVVGDDVQIIPVATLQDALNALELLGGDPVNLAQG
jgi:Lon-like protease